MGSTAVTVTVINTIILLCVLLVAYHMYLKHKAHEKMLQAMQDDFNALCLGATGVDGQLNRLGQQLKHLSDKHHQLDRREPGQGDFDKAIRLIRHGADLNELMANCGLMRAEAELLLMLHGNGKRQAA
ncbi:MAG: DUF2802 domain-containing protein [Gammaproteobacteria bacterium]